MRKLLAKVGTLEAWVENDTVIIMGLQHQEPITIERAEFFLVEKLMHKVVQGFLNGD